MNHTSNVRNIGAFNSGNMSGTKSNFIIKRSKMWFIVWYFLFLILLNCLWSIIFDILTNAVFEMHSIMSHNIRMVFLHIYREHSIILPIFKFQILIQRCDWKRKSGSLYQRRFPCTWKLWHYLWNLRIWFKRKFFEYTNTLYLWISYFR